MDSIDQIYYEDELGVTSTTYQKRAADCLGTFLAAFQPSPKSHRPKFLGNEDTPFSLRITQEPPSVQILQYPQGGVQKGIQRMRRKMTGFAGMLDMAPQQLVLAHAGDLTRECIIVSLRDDTMETILKSGLLSPEQVAQLLKVVREGHPDLLVVVQRYIMGIEAEAGLQVPYSFVAESDRATFEYLTALPENLM
ncbi:hypothetical protein HYW83_02145 [Candidatus Peregrinibacteria bacterium]|nr:hypothetical protein [Candidatus Peregrinibacteria bacterium]